MTLRSQVAHGLKWQAITIVGRQLLSLVVFTTLARLLDPAAFGLVALVGLYTFLASMLVDLGIGTALVQRANLEREHLDTAFWFNVALNAALCAATIILAHPVAGLLGEPQVVPLLRWCSLGLLIGSFTTVHGTLFVKAMDFRRPALRTLIAGAVGGAVGVGMAIAGYGVWALVGQQLATAAAGSLFLGFASSYRPSPRFSFSHLRELLDVGLSVFANSLIWFFTSRLDQFVIGRFAGVPDLGLYVIAGKIPELAKMSTQQPMTEVLVPAMAKLQHDLPRMRQAMYHGSELNAMVMFAVFVGLAAVAPDLVPLMFGSKWAEAATVCSLLSIYALVNATQVFFYPALLASGVTGKYVALSVAQATGVLLACVVGIRLGVPYLVAGLILNSLILTVPALLLLRHRIGLSPLEYLRPCLVPALASLFMLGVIYTTTLLLPAEVFPWLRLACNVAIGATAYLAFVRLFSPATIENLLQSLRKALHREESVPEIPVLTAK